jgi:uncharacterized protein (TIGR02996 family)
VNEENGFLLAISEAPDDLGLRLVYADWLEDQEDPRGEFLRLRPRLAGLPPGGSEYARLRKREQELLPDCLARWLAIPKAPVWCLLGGGVAPPLPDWLADRNTASWQSMIGFYEEFDRHPEWAFVAPLLRLVREVTGSETAKLFRAGQSLWHLMISTAAEHGLKQGDPFVAVTLSEEGRQFDLDYWDTTGGESVSRQSCGEGEILTPLGQMLARLWSSTRGRASRC